MKRTMQLTWAAAAMAGLVAACGGSAVVDPGAGGSGTGAGGTGAGGTSGAGAWCGLGTVGTQPPGPAPSAMPPVHGNATFAVSRIYLGDRDWNGVPSASAWKQYGFNLDNTISTAQTTTGLCIPAAGAPPSKVYPDGDGGIDNAFGKMLMPIFVGLTPDWSEQINELIDSGAHTVLIDVIGLGEGAAYSDLEGSSWRGARLSVPPTWDGSDLWPPYSGTDGDFSCGYATGHQVVLAQGATLELQLLGFIGDVPWVLKVHRPIVTMQLANDHRTVTQGLVAGIIDTEELGDDFRAIAGYMDPGLCNGATIDQVIHQFEQASDIMIDGSQDPGQTCNGISIGFGFRGNLVRLGGAEGQPPLPPDPCGPQPGSG